MDIDIIKHGLKLDFQSVPIHDNFHSHPLSLIEHYNQHYRV